MLRAGWSLPKASGRLCGLDQNEWRGCIQVEKHMENVYRLDSLRQTTTPEKDAGPVACLVKCVFGQDALQEFIQGPIS